MVPEQQHLHAAVVCFPSTTQETVTASLSSHCFKGLFSGWHCYLWWLQNLSTYRRTLNNDPSFTWQDGCNYFSSQEGSCWLRKVSNFPGCLQWYLPDKPTDFSDGSQHSTAVRIRWSQCNIYILYWAIVGTYLPLVSPFCPNFSGLPIQIKAPKIKRVSTHTLGSSFENDKHTPVPLFN